jgi:RNA polymerase sigma-70 factor (ECF subfamily)
MVLITEGFFRTIRENAVSEFGLSNENELLQRISEDPQAFAAIYDHYYPRIYNYTRSRIGNREDSEDITSLVFEKMFNRLDTFNRQKGSFAGWVFTIAHNAVSDHLRSMSRKRLLPLEGIGELACTLPGPEDMYITGENNEELLAALRLLSDRERSLIGLKFWARLSNRSIAQIMDISESNVGVILHRSVRRLRSLMNSPAEG